MEKIDGAIHGDLESGEVILRKLIEVRKPPDSTTFERVFLEEFKNQERVPVEAFFNWANSVCCLVDQIFSTWSQRKKKVLFFCGLRNANAESVPFRVKDKAAQCQSFQKSKKKTNRTVGVVC